VVRLFLPNRIAGSAGRDLVGDHRILLAEIQNKLFERGAIDHVAIVQGAFKLITEQRSELLPVAHAF
jgi:hypothetical protein